MKRFLYSIGVVVLMLTIAGCPSKQTVGQLTQVLGNASAQIASLEGNSVLAAKIKTDTDAAVTAINNWQPGTPAQQAIQALNLVVTDLNLIPGTSQYAPLIVLAVSTAESIIVILEQSKTTVKVQAMHRAGGVTAPKTASQFKKQWNELAQQRGLTQAQI